MVLVFGQLFQTAAWDHEYFKDQENTDLYKQCKLIGKASNIFPNSNFYLHKRYFKW